MRSKIRLALVISLVFHVVLLIGLFSGVDRHKREAEGLLVELVSLGQTEAVLTPIVDSTGSSDLLPPKPAFPMGSDENVDSDSKEEDAPLPEPSSVEGDEELVSPPFDQEEQETTLPEESTPSIDPDLPPMDDIEEPFPEEEAKPEGAFRLVAEVDPSEKGSAGMVSREGTGYGSTGGGAPQPTVGDALPGGSGIGGAGRGQSSPRFVMPSTGRSNPKPRYPERARAEGREGTALLRVTVLPTGKVGEALIERSSGHSDLDQSAVEAVSKWIFLPARRGENPVASFVRIPVTFAIDRP
jgi:protein TonB